MKARDLAAEVTGRYTTSDMYRALPNAIVGRALYDAAGLSPWAATA